MKTKEEIYKDLFATLAELQSGTVDDYFANYLRIKLEVLYDILGDEVPEEYWKDIEKEISKRNQIQRNKKM
jgi:hypothetical protein